MLTQKVKKGTLLLAEPAILGDETFARAVVLVAEHNSKGSVGFILNKPFSFYLHELVPEITAEFTLYKGGPVEEDNLYFIHNVPEQIPNSIEIADGIYWGGDFELTKSLINLGKITAKNIRFFLGYSGWAVHQLEDELQSNAWIAVFNEFKDALLSK